MSYKPKAIVEPGRKASGFTLLELLVVLTLIGIIMAGLHGTLDSALSAQTEIQARRELLTQARFAIERMAAFVAASDAIVAPAQGQSGSTLIVTERLLDTYNNSTRAYVAAGDGMPDADNNADGRINEDPNGTDPPETIRFFLDATEPDNVRIMEIAPDYATAALDDYGPPTVICDRVTGFVCTRTSATLVEIRLEVGRGESRVSLFTRIKAGMR